MEVKLKMLSARLMPLAAAILFLTTAHAADGTTLSLDDCLNLALSNNPTVMAQKEAFIATETGVSISRSSLLPRLSASSGYTRSGNGSASDSYSSSLSLSQTLFEGGANLASLRAARIQTEIARQNLNLTINAIVESVRQAFYSVLQKEDRLSVTENILKRRKEDLVLIRLKYRAGIESDAAVEEAEANLAGAEYDEMTAREGLRLAKVGLNFLMGRSKDEILDIVRDEKMFEFPSRDEAVLAGLEDRPELSRERSRLELENAYLSQSRSEFFPDLSLSASVGRRGEDFLQGDDTWSAGVNLSLPMFQGFKRTASYSQRQANQREQEAQYSQTRQSVEEEIEKAYSDWVLAKKRMEVAQKSLSAATGMYSLTRLQYQQGTVAYFVFQQRELSLTRAENERVNALFNLYSAGAALEKALGRPGTATSKGER
jgi:outer membrane protein